MIRLIKFALKLGFLKDHRRKIAVVVIAATAAIEALTNPDLIGMCTESTFIVCTWLSAAQPWLITAAAYVGSVGHLFRNEAKGLPKKKR